MFFCRPLVRTKMREYTCSSRSLPGEARYAHRVSEPKFEQQRYAGMLSSRKLDECPRPVDKALYAVCHVLLSRCSWLWG